MSTPKKKSGAKPVSLRQQDPFLERELANYDHPLPSREYILQLLTEEGVPLAGDVLAARLDISADEMEFFRRRLGAMVRDGQLVCNRRGAFLLPDKAQLVKGKVQGHPDGFGFVVPEEGGDDIFLAPKEMREVLHGDRVLVRIAGVDFKGRPEGKVVEILSRGLRTVVGRVHVEHGVAYLVAENRRISQDILLVQEGKPRFAHGQVVVAEIIEYPTKYAQTIGKVIEVLGNYLDDGMEIEIALRKHDLPFEFSSAVKEEARKLPLKVRKKDWPGREDLRDLPLVTIDGETAKDFDDAVFCARDGKGFRLIVAIADVSHYVLPGSALDDAALERGNSVYFPRRVIPMLPERLSNELCSLKPQVERLAMVCDMAITPKGEVVRYRFYPAVIFSHARLTYTQVAQALYGEGDELATGLATVGDLLPHLRDLDALYRLLSKARGQRGAIDFETIETRMVFDDNGKIAQIVPAVRNDAHRIIEECMLAANVCSAKFLLEHEQPALYRIHDGPRAERLTKLRDFLGEFGLSLGGGDEPQAEDYARLLDKIKPRPDFALLQTVMLRSLSQAMYSPDNIGHFGLAYEAYAHFTSPIRRYPDLLVHRAIKAVLAGERYQVGATETAWDDVGLHCSQTERRADEATRDVESWLKCFYMKERVGEEFEGSVSAVVPFGLFVALDDVFIEGLVHISDLGADYYRYDETRHALVGERTGSQFRLADRVRVKLMRVDLESSKIDFQLLGRPVPAPVLPSADVLPTPEQIVAELSAPARRKRRTRSAASTTPPVVKAPVVAAVPAGGKTSRAKTGKVTPPPPAGQGNADKGAKASRRADKPKASKPGKSPKAGKAANRSGKAGTRKKS